MSRSSRAVTFALVALALSLPGPCSAQARAEDLSQTNPGRVAIGLNAGAVLSIGAGFPVIGPNVTFNSNRRSALQISSSWMTWSDEYSRETSLLYAVQYRRTYRDSGDSRAYWTVGGVGVVAREHVKARNGTFYSSGAPFHTNAASHTFAVAPLLPVVGFGTEKFVSPRLAIRGDIVLSFMVMRAAVGLSVPLGRLK